MTTTIESLIMSRRKSLIVFFSIGLFLWVQATLPISAQSSRQIRVNGVDWEENGSSLRLQVYFSVRDQNQKPVANADVVEAFVVIPDDGRQEFTATITRPEAPLNVSLLLDLSGSMVNNIDTVRQAAKSQLATAPATARFEVAKFSGTYSLLQPMTEDRNLIHSAIDSTGTPEGATCLYDTILWTLNRFEASRQARNMIIVFTDGRDRANTVNEDPCSRATYAQVIQRAKALEVPIHTIGMAASAGDVDVQELRNMAEQTGGYPAIGDPGAVGDLFRQAFSGLGSEYMAEADVFASQGTHEAELHVLFRDSPNPPSPALFQFRAARDFRPATPTPAATATTAPVIMRVDPLQPDFQRGVYDLRVDIGNPSRVVAVVLKVADSNGILVYNETLTTDGAGNILLHIPMNSLRSGEEYVATLQAVDRAGNFIQKPDDNFGRQSGNLTILEERPFGHQLPDPEPVEAEIQSVVVDFASKQLVIDLTVDSPDRVDNYAGILFDDETGQRIHQFGPEVFIGSRVVEALPDVIGNLTSPHTFRLVILIDSEEGLPSRTEEIEFTAVPPPLPNWRQRLSSGIRQNTAWLAAIMALLFAGIGWALWGKREKKKPYQLEQPISDQTVLGGGRSSETGRQPRLRIRVLQTPSAADRVEHVISTFPCTVGRSDKCQLHFTGDSQMSRRHARLERNDGVFFLSDLSSDNGTYIDNNPIAPNTPTQLADVQTVSFGRQTSVEIRIQYF